MYSFKSSLPGILMVIVSLLVLSQAVVMENQSIIDPASGSFFPALIALIMLGAGIVTIFQDRSSTQKKAAETAEQENESNEADALETFTKKDYKLILIYFCLVIGFVILLPILTFFPAAFLFLLTSMFYLKGVSWLLNVTVSLATIVVIYFLFSQLFNIVFP
ncbi:tripartite tricarboxylate transporter TctB family protein [Alteribacillus sp. YIM 98480]|uniref:tripartite tricarboxylate transporter TctB family protein n=1 Tax=Alteribacillus sp. YIM 98480 TaxID=2606599 RepID=UPI00131BF327|nr:tripartite tricarboxylate transporter TctB family protein [Alteribacillus sp. YIM 98480]